MKTFKEIHEWYHFPCFKYEQINLRVDLLWKVRSGLSPKEKKIATKLFKSRRLTPGYSRLKRKIIEITRLDR